MSTKFRALPPVRIISQKERPWASKRLQMFLGRFELCPETGLYFDATTPKADRCLLVTALADVPRELVETARSLGLTLSCVVGRTPNGNASTTYADWSRTRVEEISPHTVFGSPSLTSALVLPHATHELCHLFFAKGGIWAQAAWRAMLAETVGDDLHEVTEYAQEFREDWLLERERNPSYASKMFDRYAAESFCETVAALVAPGYRAPACNVDLTRRQKLIEEMGLKFGICCGAGCSAFN